MLLADVRHTMVYLLDFFVLRYSVLCTGKSLSLDLYVLGDDVWISQAYFMQMCLDSHPN